MSAPIDETIAEEEEEASLRALGSALRHLPDDATTHDHGLVRGDEPAPRAVQVLRRGVRTSPELRRGLTLTLVLALVGAAGKLTVPVLIQQLVDKAIVGVDHFDAGLVAGACMLTVCIVLAVAAASRQAFIRLVVATEGMLLSLRVEAFAHVHRLSIADHNDARRGELTARVTSDIEIIARFTQWAGIAWIVNSVMIAGTLVVMAVYSWQLTLVVVVVFVPILPIMWYFQRRQLEAYDRVRRRVGQTLSEFSESVMGAGVIRAYGIERRSRRRLQRAIAAQYRAEMSAAKYFALMFPLADLFSGLALAAVIAVAAIQGPAWGLDVGTVLAFVFLVNLVLTPVAELGEILDQTQQGIAGWARVFDLLDQPVDVVEPEPGVVLPDGPLAVRVAVVDFAYREGPMVLRGIDVEIEPGTHVAVVGETGSGKTTFTKLLCRFADPTAGHVLVGGVDLREATASSRNHAIRIVPQDGFLFDTSVVENVRYGLEGSTEADVLDAFGLLGLVPWVESLPAGLDTEVGERGENLSVGERQLVALARAQLARPGLLLLDEATSAVDPETERMLSSALGRLSAGRTTITVAHRLATAEHADAVLVFDHGQIVERGTHDELLALGGRYAELYASWLGNTRRR